MFRIPSFVLRGLLSSSEDIAICTSRYEYRIFHDFLPIGSSFYVVVQRTSLSHPGFVDQRLVKCTIQEAKLD